MSKKNEKRSALEKELERRIEMYSKNPFFIAEPIPKYCEIIRKAAFDGCGDFAYISLKEREQYSPSGLHQITGFVAVISPTYADPSWMKSSEGDIPDAEIFIGEIVDPVTGLPKTRAFVRRKIEETGEDCYNELESIHTVAVAKYSSDSQNDEAYKVTADYGIIIGFTNSKMFELYFCETPSVSLIKEFISSIAVALTANPEKKIINMPSKEMFHELLSKLILLKKDTPIPSDGEDNDVSRDGNKDRSHYKKFPKQAKFDIVRRIKEGQLTEIQAAKEVGIHSSAIYNWIREYEKYGKNAFRGRGRISPKGINTGTPYRNSYSRQLKMTAVKLVKENNQPMSQVENKLGIDRGNLSQWLLQYEKYGENAFRGSGCVSPFPDKRELIAKLFQNVSTEDAASDTAPGTDANKNGILNLPYDKEKMLESCSCKLKKYDREFKIETVKKINEHQLPVPQVSEITGIDVSILNRWISRYKKDGENAFRGPGPKTQSNQKVDAPVQNESAEAAVLSTDSTHEKEKKVVSGSSKRKEYDPQYKKAVVKYVNENNLSPFQAAKELNIPYLALNRWIRLDKQYGEHAFPGPGVYRDELIQAQQSTPAVVNGVSIPN